MNAFSHLMRPLAGALAVIFLCASTFTCFIPVFIIGVLKLIPIRKWQAQCAKAIDAIAVVWSGLNNAYLSLTRVTHWHVEGDDGAMCRKNNFLLMANHQTWLDIVVLQKVFHRKIPVLKFFIKSQLKWMPLLGFAWWAMGCPFMKRYSKEYLEKYPHKKGKDLHATRKSLRLFEYYPTSLINFVEGTRYTKEKQQAQNSPYTHLLRPKAGGISFVLSAMGEKITHILDVSIVYPCKHPSLWDFLCHRIKDVYVHIREIEIPDMFKQEKLASCKDLQHAFREWLNTQWAEKDALIGEVKVRIQ